MTPTNQLQVWPDIEAYAQRDHQTAQKALQAAQTPDGRLLTPDGQETSLAALLALAIQSNRLVIIDNYCLT